MKITTIAYPVILMMLIWVPITRYYSSTPDINACVLDYVDNLEESEYKWYMYDINWIKHIEPLNSKMNESLKQYRIWETNWCLMSSNNLFNDMNNTFYCTITYMIRNAPISDKLKQPLWIIKEK
jgi:hypothetical protein